MRGSYLSVRAVRRALAIVGSMAALAGASASAVAAPGDVIRTVTLPASYTTEVGTFFCDPDWGASGTSIAIVTGASVGLPQEAVLLVTSCHGNGPQASKLFFFRTTGTATGAAQLVLTVTTVRDGVDFAPPMGWGSLAFRTDKGDLLACGNQEQSDGEGNTHTIYRVPLSKTFATLEAPTTTPVELFVARPGYGFQVCDGVGWDTVENRVYQSPDAFHTIYRFDEAGNPVGSDLAVPVDCTPTALGDGTVGAASGVSVAGENLYIGCNPPPPVIFLEETPTTPIPAKIFRVNKNTGAVLERFTSPHPFWTSDLECDPITFGAQQRDVLWTKGAFDDNLVAVEVTRGTCGGAPPVAGGPLCRKADGTPDLTDTDGDGLLDCWERSSPTSAGMSGQPCIDQDGDGLCDLALCVDSGDGKGNVCASPYRKDVFLEIDWLEGHKPNQAAITRVINKFDVAPVTNPVNPATGTSIGGVRLHVLLDDLLRSSTGTIIPHNIANAFANALIAFEPYTTVAGSGVHDFDVLKQGNFGTAGQRANPKALDAKRQAFRYMIFAHLMSGLGGSSGAAEVHGNDGLVTLGAAATVLGHQVGSEDQQAGTFMHELGHLLGLRHGGGDFVGCKPNYLSVMNYTRQLPGGPLASTQWKATGLDYSRSKLPDLDKGNLNEQVGIGGVTGDMTVFGPGSGIVRSTTAAIDWNRNFSTSNTAFSIPFLNQIINSSGTVCAGDGIGPGGTAVPDGMLLPGYNDWANLKYDVRSSLDVADGTRITLETKEAELGFEAPAGNECTNADLCPVVVTITDEGPVDSDRDGVVDLADNCPTVANPQQNDGCAETSVSIDIRPARYPNTVRLNSPFPLAVAILGAQNFDATEVRPNTIDLSGAKVTRLGQVHLCGRLDVNRDGFMDLVCIVDKRDLILPSDDAVALLTAKTRADVSIRGEDSIHIIRGTKSHHEDD